MTGSKRAIALLCITAASPLTSCNRSTVGERVAAGQTPPDSSFASMQVRGQAVMGVDQYQSSHKFEDLTDGGRIELVSSTGEARDVAAIRAHLKQIAVAFRNGDFTNPAIVHAGPVPGASVLARRKEAIRYEYSDRNGGGEVRIVTTDKEALSAVHEFLLFQRTAHHAH